MKMIKAASLLCLGLISGAAVATPLADLNQLRWQHRIILVDETTQQNNAQALLKRLNNDVEDRDVVWFVFQKNQTLTNYSGTVSAQLFTQAKASYGLGNHSVILVGKDGGVKTRLDYLGLKELFGDIDRMPMRISEMRQK